VGSIQLVEVGLRDGLQNEKSVMSVSDRARCAQVLRGAGLSRIELGAFVSSQRVPQMAGTADVVTQIKESKLDLKGFSVLVPNEQGYEAFIENPIPEIAIFGSVTESFSQKNINCSIAESLERFKIVIQRARKDKVRVRGYLSMCFGCPYEGEVDPKKVVQLTKTLLKMGCFEVSIGDTIGVASPADVKKLIQMLKKSRVPLSKIAGHFHDTRGTALANIATAQNLGVSIFDTSIGGLGGCPYAPGASGNVATEDVVYMFQRMGHLKKINLKSLIDLNHQISSMLGGRPLPSKVSQAGFGYQLPFS
jgi:hydroxymethylglutaryl-CoA lyase